MSVRPRGWLLAVSAAILPPLFVARALGWQGTQEAAHLHPLWFVAVAVSGVLLTMLGGAVIGRRGRRGGWGRVLTLGLPFAFACTYASVPIAVGELRFAGLPVGWQFPMVPLPVKWDVRSDADCPIMFWRRAPEVGVVDLMPLGDAELAHEGEQVRLAGDAGDTWSWGRPIPSTVWCGMPMWAFRVEGNRAVAVPPKPVAWRSSALWGWVSLDGQTRVYLAGHRLIARRSDGRRWVHGGLWWAADVRMEASRVPVLVEEWLDEGQIAAIMGRRRAGDLCLWGQRHRVTILNSDGSVAQRVASAPGRAQSVALSPDGRWLVYTASVWLSKAPRVVLVDVAHRAKYLLSPSGKTLRYDWELCFSPDSSKLAVWLDEGSGVLRACVILLPGRTAIRAHH